MDSEASDQPIRHDDEQEGGEDEDEEEEDPKPQVVDSMKLEEEKLKSRYPPNTRPGGTAFLQKRLNKGLKYFDSGDYNMAKAKGQQKARLPVLQQPTGEAIPTAIPTPDNLPTRKTSLVQSKLATGESMVAED